MSRRYGVWTGNPRGVAEDTTKCVEEVWPVGRSMITHQCRRNRGYGKNGEYCFQHCRDTTNITPIRKEK